MKRHLVTSLVNSAASLVSALVFSGCASSQIRPLPGGKVVVQVSVEQKERLLTRLGYTNILFNGNVERDSMGTRLFIRVDTAPYPDEDTNQWVVASWLRRRGQLGQATCAQPTNQLVVVTAEGVHLARWPRETYKVADDEQVAVAAWHSRGGGTTWRVRSGEVLPTGYHVMSVSGDWVAIGAPGRAPWVAKLDTPTVAAAALPDSSTQVSLYSNGETVHVFARCGWLLNDGPMRYLVFDLAGGSSRPIKEMTVPWALCSLDMDPETGVAVLNDNSRFWGRTWLLDLNTGKRRWIPSEYWTRIVRKEVAQKWVELTKP